MKTLLSYFLISRCMLAILLFPFLLPILVWFLPAPRDSDDFHRVFAFFNVFCILALHFLQDAVREIEWLLPVSRKLLYDAIWLSLSIAGVSAALVNGLLLSLWSWEGETDVAEPRFWLSLLGGLIASQALAGLFLAYRRSRTGWGNVILLALPALALLCFQERSLRQHHDLRFGIGAFVAAFAIRTAGRKFYSRFQTDRAALSRRSGTVRAWIGSAVGLLPIHLRVSWCLFRHRSLWSRAILLNYLSPVFFILNTRPEFNGDWRLSMNCLLLVWFFGSGLSWTKFARESMGDFPGAPRRWIYRWTILPLVGATLLASALWALLFWRLVVPPGEGAPAYLSTVTLWASILTVLQLSGAALAPLTSQEEPQGMKTKLGFFILNLSVSWIGIYGIWLLWHEITKAPSSPVDASRSWFNDRWISIQREWPWTLTLLATAAAVLLYRRNEKAFRRAEWSPPELD